METTAITFTIEQIPTMPDGIKFSAVPDGWDLGTPLGYGKTIQEAIDDLLMNYELLHDVEVIKFCWR